jgi:hypothetical protein
MPRQEEVAFVKAIPKMHLSHALLKELRLVLTSRRKNRIRCLLGSAAPHMDSGLDYTS